MPKENTARRKDPSLDSTLKVVAGAKSGKHAEPLDGLIHERKRLAIVSALAVNSSLSFSELKKLLELSDGNLSVHAQKLETAKYIACKKSFRGRIPRTEYRITQAGRKALDKYLAHMERLIHSVRSG